uniref:GAT domain-containing protein n=1 Tax=Gongylonema pulchrum TaxID=637853 RepID=A0A183E2W2_9BILA
LASTEQKLQEELHVEQAVQDIVRLIKQDARTALLIVQLLRRYQLERSQAVTAATQVDDDHHCEAEVQHSAHISSNSQELVPVGKSQQCISSMDAPMESVQSTLQQKANDTTVEEDEPQPCTQITLPLPKPKSRKKNSVTRTNTKSDNTDTQEKASGHVDMEEIFKRVLENASKALAESSAEKRLKSCTESSSSRAPEHFQIEKTTASCSERQEQRSCLVDENSSSTTATLPSCEQLMQPFVSNTPPATTYNVSQGMETDLVNGHYEERVEVLEEGAVDAPQSFQYSKNQAFDDLMDVLRDDQAGIGDSKTNVPDFEAATIYGSDELATLLGDDWFQHDCAMSDSQTAERYIACTNLAMDWLDMMLPCSVHGDTDTGVIDSIR